MMSLTFGLFTQMSGSGPLGPLVTPYDAQASSAFSALMLRDMGTPPCFPAILAQRDNFCDFLFASLDKVALQNRVLLLQNRGPFDKFNFDRIRTI